MSNKEIKFGVIEDSSAWREVAKKVLTQLGYELDDETMAETYDEAVKLISQINKLGLTHILLDYNLSDDQEDNSEGVALLSLIRENNSDVIVYGYSDSKERVELGEKAVPVDHKLGKSGIMGLKDVLRGDH